MKIYINTLQTKRFVTNTVTKRFFYANIWDSAAILSIAPFPPGLLYY